MSLRLIKASVKIILIVIVGIVFCIFVVLLMFSQPADENIEEWNEFKAAVMQKYSCIESVGTGGHHTSFIVNIYLKANVDEEIIMDIFEKVKGFILTENNFAEIVKIHQKRYDAISCFWYLSIRFYDVESDGKRVCEFFSHQDADGVADHNSFTEWWYFDGHNEWPLSP